MSERLLSVLLIGFATLFLWIILGWATFSSFFGITDLQHSLARSKYDRLKKIHIAYKIILILFVAVDYTAFFFPSLNKYYYPISLLNNDSINIIGLVILLLALLYILYAQRRLDKELHHYYYESEEKNMNLSVPSAENHLLTGILLMFVGMFVIISTIVTALLVVSAFIVFYIRLSNRNYKVKTPLTTYRTN
jgi:hypothetical protein